MRVLVVGASGQLGGHLVRGFTAAGHEVSGTCHSQGGPELLRVDLDDEAALCAASRAVRAELVVLAAGWTWVDANEDDPAAAWRRNCDHPLALARACAAEGARFVTYSTDYVFDGERGGYREDDPPRPLNVYGEAKLGLERGLAELPGALVLRTSTVYGPEAQGKNFVYQLVRRLRAGQPFRVPSDQTATPSYAPDVAAVTLALVERGAEGVWHVTGPDALDRGAFSAKVCAEWGLDPSGFEALPTAALGQKARRPLRADLDTSKLRAAGLEVRGVEAGLRAMRAAIEAGGWATP
ncbi:MAG: NAD(P)-dependent oxidoreductase [Planctomycetota bacterium]